LFIGCEEVESRWEEKEREGEGEEWEKEIDEVIFLHRVRLSYSVVSGARQDRGIETINKSMGVRR